MNDDVLEEREGSVAGEGAIAVLAVAKIVRPRLVVRLVESSDTGHEAGVGAAVVVVCVVQVIVPWRRTWCGGFDRFPWLPETGECVLDAEHVELRREAAVFVVVGIVYDVLGVDGAGRRVASVGRRQALATNLAAIVVYSIVRADAGNGERARLRLRAIVRVVVVQNATGAVGVGSVEGHVLADERDVVAGLDEGALDVDIVPSIVRYIDFIVLIDAI